MRTVYRLNHTVTAWRSKDLLHWDAVGDALPISSRPSGVYYWPKVVQHPKTMKFVMWINYVNHGFSSTPYLSAVSDTPEGPFTVVNSNITSRWGAIGSVDLFVDDDGSAYVVYTSLAQNHRISLAQLSDDFTDILIETNTGLMSPDTLCSEAPVLFKRLGLYYVMWGQCCCFCAAGTDLQVYTAQSPLAKLEDWTYRGDPGCNSTRPSSPEDPCEVRTPGAGTLSTTGSQINSVIHISPTQLLFLGQRWGSAPDKLKSHDFNY
eukprot:CAMPEP_0114563772 /NCGR_PEP_ID=MMETSP0114-20121206/13311_1 /TAXON_ID=31324 /ORGANISM="Goniomonas sp, Strain m" /LENGTH=262 /DNA_ID=CAMNT_0001749687 /DNA_START=165 /DNA_END=950 /DNA_ORIENTATION=-